MAALVPARQRAAVLEGFSEQIATHCAASPVLWVIEDAHWIHPTTEELIARVVDRAANLRLLILVTHRPEYRAPWLETLSLRSYP